VQPGGQRRPGSDGAGAAGQDEERRLEGVLGQVGVGQQAAADAPDQRPVPGDQRGEGGLLAVAGEAVEQGGVGGRAGGGRGGQPSQVVEQGGGRGGHAALSG
jgi:hypothetical protein